MRLEEEIAENFKLGEMNIYTVVLVNIFIFIENKILSKFRFMYY